MKIYALPQLAVFGAAAVVEADGFLFAVGFFLAMDTQSDSGNCPASGFGDFFAAFFAILKADAAGNIFAGTLDFIIY